MLHVLSFQSGLKTRKGLSMRITEGYSKKARLSHYECSHVGVAGSWYES